MERLRRLFNRAQLDRNELNIMRGILSAVQGRRGYLVRSHSLAIWVSQRRKEATNPEAA